MRKTRKEKGYSQDDLALLLGVTRQTVYRWENDFATPSVENIVALNKVLDRDFFAVCGGKVFEVEPEATETPVESDYKQDTVQEKERAEKAKAGNKIRKYIVVISASAIALIIAVSAFVYSMSVANISLTVKDGNGQVTATATYDFSVFPKNVKIYVLLYCSTDFTVDYQDMSLIGYGFDGDFQKGKSLTVTVDAEGEGKFWIARIYYKINDGAWKERVSEPIRY